ncbi:MAG: hypothetical protein IH614_19275 [Desulfuromonadales bacterium]|nr:hypothetical protein [Desulfuromonadales bacterium]
MPREKILLPRSQCNSMCRKCVRACRQPAGVLLLDCPRFQPFPFKIAEHRYRQLDLFTEEPKS